MIHCYITLRAHRFVFCFSCFYDARWWQIPLLSLWSRPGRKEKAIRVSTNTAAAVTHVLRTAHTLSPIIVTVFLHDNRISTRIFQANFLVVPSSLQIKSPSFEPEKCQFSFFIESPECWSSPSGDKPKLTNWSEELSLKYLLSWTDWVGVFAPRL